MGIQVSWHEQLPRTVFYQFAGRWSWQDYIQAMEMEKDFAASLQGQAYCVLADLRQTALIPQQEGLFHLHRSAKQSPRNFKMLVVVTTSLFIENLLRSLSLFYPAVYKSMQVSKDMDKAQALIREAFAAMEQSG